MLLGLEFRVWSLELVGFQLWVGVGVGVGVEQTAPNLNLAGKSCDITQKVALVELSDHITTHDHSDIKFSPATQDCFAREAQIVFRDP